MRDVGTEVSAKLVTDKMKEMLGSITIVVVFAGGRLVSIVGSVAVEG